MHFILHNARNIAQNNFFGSIYRPIETFLTCMSNSWEKNFKIEVSYVSFLNLCPAYLTWCVCLIFFDYFFVRILIGLILFTGHFFFQNLIKTCIFLRSLFRVYYFSAFNLIFMVILRSIFIHFLSVQFLFLCQKYL